MLILPMAFIGMGKDYGDAMSICMHKFRDWTVLVDLHPSELSGYSVNTNQGQLEGVLLWFHTISCVLTTDRDVDWGNAIVTVRNSWSEVQKAAICAPIVWGEVQRTQQAPIPPKGKRDEEAMRAIIKAQNARALKMGAEGTFTYEEWVLLCEIFEERCASCGRLEDRLCTDHVIALSRRGTNFIENIQPLCRSCNSGKNAKPTDYRGDRAYTFLEALENMRNSS